MPTEIEQLIATLQKDQQELARRDREHDEHITILLGQVVTLVPEVRSIKATLAEHGDLLRQILAKLDERK
jgi:hypothetical protein